MLRRLISSADLGDRPRRKRPAGVSRESFVRSLAAQAGLSLDLVRIAFAQRAAAKGEAPAASSRFPATPEPLADATDSVSLPLTQELLETHTRLHEQQPQPPRVPLSLVTPAPAAAAIDRSERELHLKRAGRYLAVMQMDMDRLHDEAASAALAAATGAAARAASAAERRGGEGDKEPQGADGGAREKGSSGGEEAAVSSESHPVRPDADEDVGRKPQEGLVKGAESLPALEDQAAVDEAPKGSAPKEPAQETSLVCREPDAAPSPASGRSDGPDMDRAEDTATLNPRFGQFLDRHILPLYIADIPFVNLRILAEHYCGIPMDSDDESRVLESLGRPAIRPGASSRHLSTPARKTAAARRRRASQQSRGAREGDDRSASPAGRRKVSATGATPLPAESLALAAWGGAGGDAAAARRRSAASFLSDQPSNPMAAPASKVVRSVQRAQMSNSVVEKRRCSFAAHHDMAVPERARARPSASGKLAAAAAVGAVKGGLFPQSALGDMSAPATPVRFSSSGYMMMAPPTPMSAVPARTPVTIRRGSLKPEDVVAPSPVSLAPEWGLLDTPHKG